MKFAKHLKRTALMALFIAAAGSANAGIKLGDSTSLDLSVDAMATWVDNLYYTSAHRESEMSTSLTPGVTITHDAVNHFKLGFWESFVNYLNHTELDSQLASANFSYDFEPRKVVGADEGAGGSSRLHLSAHGSVTQIAQNDNTMLDTGESFSTVIRQDTYSAGVNGSYGLTPRISLSTGFSYGYHHFASLRNRYNDTQSFSVPITLFYKMPGDRYELGLTYSWGYTLIEANQPQRLQYSNPGNQTTHNAGLSFRGAVPGSAKMTMHGSVTYGFRSIDDRVSFGQRGSGYDDATLNYSVGLSYQVRDNIHASLNSGRNFDVGGRAQAITSTYVRLNVQSVIKSIFQVSTYIDYRRQDFDVGAGVRNRADNLFTVGAGLSYSSYITYLRTWTTFSLGYRFLVDDSNRIHDFDVSAVSFMVSFRY
jgi:hypothetical protein